MRELPRSLSRAGSERRRQRTAPNEATHDNSTGPSQGAAATDVAGATARSQDRIPPDKRRARTASSGRARSHTRAATRLTRNRLASASARRVLTPNSGVKPRKRPNAAPSAMDFGWSRKVNNRRQCFRQRAFTGHSQILQPQPEDEEVFAGRSNGGHKNGFRSSFKCSAHPMP